MHYSYAQAVTHLSTNDLAAKGRPLDKSIRTMGGATPTGP